MNKKTLRIIAWVVAVALTGVFFKAAIPKVTSHPAVVANFERWGYSDNFRILIGVLQLLGGIGLLIPRVWYLASVGLIGILLGAIYTHINVGETFYSALIYIVLLCAYMFLRRKSSYTLK